MRGPDVEHLRRLVILVDGAAVGTRQLARPGDDRLEHGLDIERRAHRLADLTKCRELVHRASQFGRPRLQLLEQTRVLDGNDGLVGKGLEPLDLAVREGPGLGARYRDDAEGKAFPEHRDEEAASPADRAGQSLMSVLWIALNVGYVDHRALEDRPPWHQRPGWA
jgi:hypothetical protein